MPQPGKHLSHAAVLLGSILVLGMSRPAHATLQISLTTGSGTTTITDGDVNDTNAATGKIGYGGYVGGFDISVVLSTSNSPGTPYFAQLAFGSLDLNNTLGTSNTIAIQVADQGFLAGADGASRSLTSSLSGMVTQDPGLTSTVTYQSFADAGNNPLGTFPFGTAFSNNPLSVSLTGQDGTSQGFNLKTSKDGFVDPAKPYSLASELTITLAAGASLNSVSGKTEIAVPEPSTSVVALSGLSLLGLSGLRRRGRGA